MFRNILLFLLLISLSYCKQPLTQSEQVETPSSFSQGWEFVKDTDTAVTAALFNKSNNLPWQHISLPHTAQLEPLVITGGQWQGTSLYRRFFTVSPAHQNKKVIIRFDAAMHEADVYLNGQYLTKHVGGYLPFQVDLTGKLKLGEENCVLVKLNNQDNPAIPPGKPIKGLDFNYYSGLYRDAHLLIKDKLHIPDAVAAGRKAGGGVMVYYEQVSSKAATVRVQTEVKNDYPEQREAQVRLTLLNSQGEQVGQSNSGSIHIGQGDYGTFQQSIQVNNPQLWSPEAPTLYTLRVEVLHKDQVTDQQELQIGIRTFRFTAGAFYLNSEKLFIRGTNRHQEYPYIGYALSDNANYRDAFKIKEAGFNFVRLSHYPQSTAFLKACDELGIMVMDAIPGWQFYGDEAFQQNSLQDVRDVVRRDRNHPSIILWEASLNESRMGQAYMEQAHNIVHEELPYPDVYTCGWVDQVYDVFIPARQHAKPPHYWNRYSKSKPLFIAEYGDWEYYAQNAGFNQTAFADLEKEERTSRQLRAYGEKRLLQQALNYQEAHNSNLQGPAVGDANWLMYDYNRGYAPDLESSGIMDIFRLPKFAFYFYQSQYGPVPDKLGFGKPMVTIASYWTSASARDVTVYSNCDEVELFLNGKSAGRQKPDQHANTSHLNHPPFTFTLPAFTPGELKAVAYLKGEKAAETAVRTPGQAQSIRLRVDMSNKELEAAKNDVVFVYAEVVDKDGTVVPDAAHAIKFTVEGPAELIGDNPMAAEAGIATVLLKAGASAGKIKITASAAGLESTSETFSSVQK